MSQVDPPFASLPGGEVSGYRRNRPMKKHGRVVKIFGGLTTMVPFIYWDYKWVNYI